MAKDEQYRSGYLAGYADGVRDAAQSRKKTFGEQELGQYPVKGMQLSSRAINCLTSSGCEFVSDVAGLIEFQILYPALEKFSHGKEKIRYRNCVLIFRHVYDRNRPEREYRDHDNIELNTVVDAIAMFFLVDDTPLECRHYYCSASGEKEMTEVYIVPREEFESWLAMEKCPEKLRKKLSENLPETAGK